jgi:diadenosine tetraphosphate (Ap4A) HIT family hydrolase
VGRSREPFNIEEYVARSTSGRCFICEFLSGNPEYQHIEVVATETNVVFLDRYPTLFGRVIVAPKRHLEQVTGDFELSECLDLQRLLYSSAEAIRHVLSPERVYMLSLGSQAANSHVHWHIAPLPTGVPFEQQQYHALMHEHGAIRASTDEFVAYARQVRDRLVSAGAVAPHD